MGPGEFYNAFVRAGGSATAGMVWTMSHSWLVVVCGEPRDEAEAAANRAKWAACFGTVRDQGYFVTDAQHRVHWRGEVKTLFVPRGPNSIPPEAFALFPEHTRIAP